MTAAKNVYALMLALVIVLSGCFGMTGDESDAQDSGSDENGDDSSSGGTDSTFAGADNLPPVISNTYVNNPQFTQGSDCMTSGFNIEARHAMTDWDGSIVNAGWDVDLDGVIDHPVTADEGYTTLFMPIDAMVWRNYTDSDGSLDQTRWQNSFAFGAQDDAGEWTSSPIYTFETWVWDEYNGGTWRIDVTPCEPPETPASPNSTSNVFRAEDAAAATSSGDDDTLMSIRWDSASDNLNWAYVTIQLTVGNNTYYCSTAGDQGCSIAQDGNDDAMWETGEFLSISESGSDIADGATTIYIQITYNGQTVAGTSSATVA